MKGCGDLVSGRRFSPAHRSSPVVVVPLSQLSAFKAMKDGFAQRGLDLAGILAEAGLNPDPSESIDAENLADMFSVAWGAAVARTGDPSIGLKLTPRQPL